MSAVGGNRPPIVPLPGELVYEKPSEPVHRRKGRAGIVIPIVISIIAVIISLLSYIDQYRTDRNASIAAEEANAAKVGFWLINTHSKVTLLAIENGSDLPISNVRVLVHSIQRSKNVVTVYIWDWGEYTLPPCSIYNAMFHL
jgi:hypothetical protein